MFKYFVSIATILILFACGEDDSPPAAIVQEVVTDASPASACGVSFVIRDTAYMISGRKGMSGNNGMPVNEVWRFDETKLSWKKISEFPGVQRINAVAEVVGGKAYFGLGWHPPKGWALTAYLKDFWSFDPLTYRWDSLAAYPGNDTNNPVSFVYDDEIYVLHGFESHLIASEGFTRTVRRYSVKDNAWTSRKDFPGYMRTSAVAVSDGERVFAGTGYATWNEQDWWEYFPATDSWIKREKMPDKGRCNGLAFTLKNRYFVATGRYFAGLYTGGHLKQEIMEYDPASDQWFERGTLPLGIENAVSFVLNDRVYIGYGEYTPDINSKLWKITLP